MAKTQPDPSTEEPEDIPFIQVKLRMPPAMVAKGTELAEANGRTLQHQMMLDLAKSWNLPDPPLRTKGRPSTKKD